MSLKKQKSLGNDCLQTLNQNYFNKNESSQNQLNDFQVENISESIIIKSQTIIKYFSKLLGFELDGLKMKPFKNKDDSILNYYKPYIKEISIFILLLQLEVELLIEFLNGKHNEEDDSEIHIVKINTLSNSTTYDYTNTNFKNDSIFINLENPKIEDYLKVLKTQNDQIYFLLDSFFKMINIKIDEVDTFNYLKDSMKNFYMSSTEKYFFAVFEKGVEYYSNKKISEAYEELIISKYYYENLLFIRMISHNKFKTISFLDATDLLECDDFINLNSESKFGTSSIKISNTNNFILFTFLGGIYKQFKEEKIIEEDLTTQSTIGYSKDAVDSLITFFPELLKLILECSNNNLV